MDRHESDLPMPAHDRFAVEMARFMDGRIDPSQNISPPGNPPLDVLATLQAEAELERIVG
ncbi:MAG: hypothetical protein H0V22_09735 [Solirubrobacterales bacterium]|jgi:hypothetical protein|nr:hypothetical protein [Solirubrobacterales bacterium]